jgi:RNA polymerase-binding transcription factor
MSEKLTAAERSTLAKQLEDRRRVLRSELAAKLETQDNPALLGLRNRMEETDDWAVADLETALDVAEVSRDAGELREVEAALLRMKDGSYGECIDCGTSIPYARLHANPSASRCIACQERVEASQRRGPPTL